MSAARLAAALGLLGALGSPARAGEATLHFPTGRGTGLLTVPDAAVLPRGRVLLGAQVDNRDRDPLGLDVLDGSVTLAAGLGRGLELYGLAVLSRVVALPELPPLPPPPLDLVVGSRSAPPGRPHYALYAPVPYVNKRGTARFDDFVPGDLLAGLKLRLAEARGARPALALAGEVTVPLSRRLDHLQSGAGTGAVDLGARLLALWTLGRAGLAASVAYVHTGDPPFGDRVILAGATGAEVQEMPLRLADRIEPALGLRRALGGSLHAVLEASAVLEVGPRTRVLDAAPPLDVLGGLQARWGRVVVSAGLRWHGRSLPSGQRRRAPIGGLVDLTDVEEGALAAYLEGLGLAGAVPWLRAGSQRLLAVDAPGTLPPRARLVPHDYPIRSEHQVGFVIGAAWSF